MELTLTLQTFLLLYGGLGGWLGIAFAIYLQRVCPRPAHPAAVLSVFVMGFTMLSGTALLADVLRIYHPYLPTALIVTVYTLLTIAECAVVTAHVRPAVFSDLRIFAAEQPYLTNRDAGQSRRGDRRAPDENDAE